MDYQEKLKLMTTWVEENVYDANDLLVYLDISVEDIVKCFPDALVAAYNKTFLEEPTEDEDEAEAWRGFQAEEE